MIIPFKIHFDSEDIADLKSRLQATRWNDAVAADWSYGTERTFLRQLVDYWLNQYDWVSRCALLNQEPHFRATINDYGLHFLHYRSRASNAVPLLLLNGWPSSFVEYRRLVALLSNEEPSFEIVIPTHPGFGYSDRPTEPYQVEPSELYPKLMTELGYDKFMISGTDIGSGFATRIALRHPERVIGLHVSAVAAKPLKADAPLQSVAERVYDENVAAWYRDEGGYQAIQSSKPQSLAFALADSPVGLASWIVEKFRSWSDCDGDVARVFPLETLIDNLMIYWLTNTIGSSVRYYYEAVRLRPALTSDDYVQVPTALAIWPRDIARAPRELAERLYNVQRYTVFPRGGHFPAWELPELYAEDLKQFADALTSNVGTQE